MRFGLAAAVVLVSALMSPENSVHGQDRSSANVEEIDGPKERQERARDNDDGQGWLQQFGESEERSAEEAAQDRVGTAQALLKQEGYDPGPADGKMGPRTARAIRNYQRDWLVPETGTVDADLMARLERRHPATRPQFYPIENRDCEIWNFGPQAQETVTWTGECKDGKASGRGTQTFRHVHRGKPVETETYEGSMLAGKAHGRGELRTADGYRFVGTFKAGRKHGKGVEEFASGTRFEGHFVNGAPRGKGTIRLPDGMVITGEWKDGPPTTGVMTDADGNHYQGGIADYWPHGQGKLTMADGRVLEGEFRDGKFAGKQVQQTARRPEPAKPASAPLPESDLPRIRELLREWGYRPGDSDAGLSAAIGAYQRDWQIPETGVADADLLSRLKREHPATRPQWYPVANQNCQFWNFSPNAQEKVAWTGGCTSGKTSGTGVLTLKHVKNGEPVNHGTYSGAHRNGLAHGQGDYSRWDGFRYSGGFREGWRHGRGESEWPDGARYVGDFKDGERHGRGEFRYSDGSIYDGQFVANKRHGKGQLRWGPNSRWAGDRYVGDWQNDIRSGQGEYFWANGNRYVGDIKDGREHGRGEMFWSNGNRYVGGFVDGKLHGRGEFYLASGDRRSGNWKDGKQTGSGEYIWSDGTRYAGEFKDGKFTGAGVKTAPDGTRYEGDYLDNLEHGEGTEVYSDGDRYVGAWQRGHYHGYGTYWFPDGSWCAGQFENGILVGWSTGVRHGRTVKCRHDGSRFTFFD